jgi:predicted RNase H-like HicB family nuclease
MTVNALTSKLVTVAFPEIPRCSREYPQGNSKSVESLATFCKIQNKIRFLFPLVAATLLCSGYNLVEAVQPKGCVSLCPTSASLTRSKKAAVNQKKPPQVVQPKWKLFTAPDGGFSVLMPGMPQMSSQTQKTHMGEISLQMFIAQPPKQEVAYVVAFNEFPHSYGQMTSPQEILNNAQAVALKATKSNLITARNIRSSNGHPGKEMEYINTGGKITKSRMYFAEGRLYQVMAITTKRQQKTISKTITGYLNSFQVVLRK